MVLRTATKDENVGLAKPRPHQDMSQIKARGSRAVKIAFWWQLGKRVNFSYHSRIGRKRAAMLALARGTSHRRRNSFAPFMHSPYRRNASAYSCSSSIGISCRQRQHQSIFMFNSFCQTRNMPTQFIERRLLPLGADGARRSFPRSTVYQP